MKKEKILFCFFILLVTGCETTNSVSYKASTANVIAIQQILPSKDAKVSLGTVSIASGIDAKPTCRLMGPIVVAPGKTIPQYIKDAFQEELFLAQAYDPRAGVVIEAEIDELTFSSVSPAGWKVGMAVRSNKSKGYRVLIDYRFETSWTAGNACKNVADSFAPAVQELLKKVVTDSKFVQLIS